MIWCSTRTCPCTYSSFQMVTLILIVTSVHANDSSVSITSNANAAVQVKLLLKMYRCWQFLSQLHFLTREYLVECTYPPRIFMFYSRLPIEIAIVNKESFKIPKSQSRNQESGHQNLINCSLEHAPANQKFHPKNTFKNLWIWIVIRIQKPWIRITTTIQSIFFGPPKPLQKIHS